MAAGTVGKAAAVTGEEVTREEAAEPASCGDDGGHSSSRAPTDSEASLPGCTGAPST